MALITVFLDSPNSCVSVFSDGTRCCISPVRMRSLRMFASCSQYGNGEFSSTCTIPHPPCEPRTRSYYPRKAYKYLNVHANLCISR